MKTVRFISVALLAVPMMLGVGIGPSDAGDKHSKKRVHHPTRIHIDRNVSSKNLRLLEKKLKGHHQQAVSEELKRRREEHLINEGARIIGGELGDLHGEDAIIGLGLWGTELGKRRSRGH